MQSIYTTITLKLEPEPKNGVAYKIKNVYRKTKAPVELSKQHYFENFYIFLFLYFTFCLVLQMINVKASFLEKLLFFFDVLVSKIYAEAATEVVL